MSSDRMALEWPLTGVPRHRAAALVPIILPIATTLLAVLAAWARGPFWLASNFDPAYCYLYNSMHLLMSRSPNHIDHPGTPVQIFGAGVMQVVCTLRGRPPILADVIGHPELYLNCINAAGIALYTNVLALTGRSVRRLTGSTGMMLLFQSTTFFALPCVVAMNSVAPELLLLSIGCAIGWLIVIAAVQPEKTHGWRWLIGSAALCGLALATKFTAAPLLLLFLLLSPAGYRRGVFLLIAGVMFTLCVLPIHTQWPRMADWVWALFAHSGRYGDGPANVVDRSAFMHNLRFTARQSHVWTMLMAGSLIGAALIGIVSIKKVKCRWPAWVLWSIGLTELAQLLMVAKSPNARYLLPAILLLGGQLVAIAWFARSALQERRRRPFDRLIVPTTLAILLLFGCTSAVRWAKRTHGAGLADLRFAKHVQQRYANDTKVFYYRSSSPLFALGFGMDFSHNARLERETLTQHPDLWVYSIFGGVFERSTTLASVSELFALGKRVVLIGTADPGKAFPPKGTTTRELERQGTQAVTEITPAK